ADLRAVELRLRRDEISEGDAIMRLERLVAGWRGDWIEAEALARLIDLYGKQERWRDAFSALRVAVAAFPDAESSRTLQDRMQERFTELFLGGGVDRMSKLDALALFYDFKELSPGGKRGDELVRRLADKLVEVDLLDQAAELLNYQVENRLTGAARTTGRPP
ncbi:tetratricopeptide repeat protein, partial [Hansschlegelia beijingensis]